MIINPIYNILFFIAVAAAGTLVAKLFIELGIKLYYSIKKRIK